MLYIIICIRKFIGKKLLEGWNNYWFDNIWKFVFRYLIIMYIFGREMCFVWGIWGGCCFWGRELVLRFRFCRGFVVLVFSLLLVSIWSFVFRSRSDFVGIVVYCIVCIFVLFFWWGFWGIRNFLSKGLF